MPCAVWHCVENVACLQAGNILHTVHTSCHPTLQHHNSYNGTDNYRQRNAIGSPDDGHKDARNMLRYYWLPINHYLLHLVGFSFTYLSKMHGHSNIKFRISVSLGLMINFTSTMSLLYIMTIICDVWAVWHSLDTQLECLEALALISVLGQLYV